MPSKESLDLLVAACEDDIRDATSVIRQAERDGDSVEWARGQRDLADAQNRAARCQTNIMGPGQSQQQPMWPWDNPSWHSLEPEVQRRTIEAGLSPEQLEHAKISGVDPITYAKNLPKLMEYMKGRREG